MLSKTSDTMGSEKISNDGEKPRMEHSPERGTYSTKARTRSTAAQMEPNASLHGPQPEHHLSPSSELVSSSPQLLSGQRLIAEVERLRADIEGLQAENDRLRADRQRLHAELKDRSEQASTIEVSSRRGMHSALYEAQIARLRDENQALREDLESKDDIIKRSQEFHLNALAKSALKAEDDDAIRGTLKRHHERWRAWAKAYAIKSSTEIAAGNHALLRNLLSSISDSNMWKPLWNWAMSEENSSRAPGMLLNAVFGNFMSQYVLNRPFLWLRCADLQSNSAQDLLFSETYPTPLEQVHHLLLTKNPATAHVFRSDMLRTLDPPQEDLKENLVDFIATRFEEDFPRALFRPGPEDLEKSRRAELREIILESLNYYHKLWEQRTVVHFMTTATLGKETFSLDHPFMDAHASHKLEEDDRRLDSRPVRFVTQPAVLAYGNELCTNYDCYKVWAKAVVCVSEV